MSWKNINFSISCDNFWYVRKLMRATESLFGHLIKVLECVQWMPGFGYGHGECSVFCLQSADGELRLSIYLQFRAWSAMAMAAAYRLPCQSVAAAAAVTLSPNAVMPHGTYAPFCFLPIRTLMNQVWTSNRTQGRMSLGLSTRGMGGFHIGFLGFMLITPLHQLSIAECDILLLWESLSNGVAESWCSFTYLVQKESHGDLTMGFGAYMLQPYVIIFFDGVFWKWGVEGRRCARVICMSENSGSIKRGAVGLQRFKESAIPGMYWGDRYY